MRWRGQVEEFVRCPLGRCEARQATCVGRSERRAVLLGSPTPSPRARCGAQRIGAVRCGGTGRVGSARLQRPPARRWIHAGAVSTGTGMGTARAHDTGYVHMGIHLRLAGAAGLSTPKLGPWALLCQGQGQGQEHRASPSSIPVHITPVLHADRVREASRR